MSTETVTVPAAFLDHLEASLARQLVKLEELSRLVDQIIAMRQAETEAASRHD